jgi:hypothetical protein
LVPTDRVDALAASGGSANAIAFPSGSGTFTWRTRFEHVWIGSCSMPSLGCEALEERVEPGDGEGDAGRARALRVRLDEEPGVLIGVSPGTRPSAKRVPRRVEPSESARAGS